jgi:Bacterial archaeo-eukaryotic release factor family 12
VTAAFLNKLSLDGTIEHLVVVSDPRTLGEMRKHFHRDLRGKIKGELAKGLQPESARGRRLTDRRRLTRPWKRLPAQARPVITRTNNSKLPTTTTALDQPEPNQPSKCISNGQDSPSCLWHSKQHQEEARFCCLLGVTFQSLTRLTSISH